MTRLILHIGTHKTATTAIQNALESNREAYRAAGFWYARTDRPPLAHQPKHNSLFKALGSDAAIVREADILLDELDQSGCKTLVLSDEGLSSPQFDKAARIRTLTERFDEVIVVCFLRRQDLFLESLWNQFCMARGEKRSLKAFARSKNLRERLNYADILDFWAGFGTVRAVSFEEAKQKGVFPAFAEIAGMPVIGEALARNVSPSMNCAALINLLNQDGLEFDKRVMIRAFATDKRKYGLGSVLRREVLAFCEPINARLARDHGVTFSDELPEEPDAAMSEPDPAELAKAVSFMSNRTLDFPDPAARAAQADASDRPGARDKGKGKGREKGREKGGKDKRSAAAKRARRAERAAGRAGPQEGQ